MLALVLGQVGLVNGLVVANVALVQRNKLPVNDLIVLLDQVLQQHFVCCSKFIIINQFRT